MAQPPPPQNNRPSALAVMPKDSDDVHRCNSLFDLETDQLMKSNQQGSGKLGPEWKMPKYKICGSFVESKRGDVQFQTKTSNLAHVVMDASGMAKAEEGLSLKRTSRPKRLKREISEGDFDVKNVDNVDDVLHTKETASYVLPTSLNLSPSPMVSVPMRQQQALVNTFPSSFSMDMAKRNSFLDFEKTMQYLQHGNGGYTAYPNMLNNQTIFNSFLSSSSGSFSNLLNFNKQPRCSNLNTGGSAENNFNIDAREVEETEYAPVSRLQPAARPPFKRNREFEVARSRGRKRGKWSESEDRLLQQLAMSFLERKEKINFKKIADKLQGRSAKQCREHWLSTLNPDLKKGRWTKAEEVKLLDLMIEHGKSWSVIAKQIPGRAEHSVKAKGRLMLGERLKSIASSAVAYTGSDEQQAKLLVLHKQLGTEFDEISKQCGFIISPAKIERTLLAVAETEWSKRMNDKIKATNTNNFLQGWTMVKSAMIKNTMVEKSSKYYQQQLLAQQQGMSQLPKDGFRS